MNLLEKAEAIKNGVATLKEWLGSGGICVDQHLAQKRADVCTGRISGTPCPNNVQDFQFAEAVSAVIRKHIELKSKLQLKVMGDRSLFVCNGCGCPLKLKVFVPLDKLGNDEESLKQFPAFCWMKTEKP